MAMIVDEARTNGAAVGVDGLPGRARELADFGDLPVLDPNVAVECRHAGPIHDRPVLYQQIVRHCLSLLRPARAGIRSSRRKCSTATEKRLARGHDDIVMPALEFMQGSD